MYKRILVPLDGSKLSEQVLPYVRTMGDVFDSSIELLRVVPSHLAEQVPSHGSQELSSNLNLHTQSLDYLNSKKMSLGNLDVKTSCMVDEDDPGSCIAREAQKDSDTLIAISTHGRMGVGRWVVGSVMDKVLRTADKPLLVVRPGDGEENSPETEISLKSIIVPLDGSSSAEEKITPHVVAFAKALDLDVVLLMVPYGNDDKAALKYLGEFRELLSREGVGAVQEVVRFGRPGDAILDVATEIEDSIVAITTHGRSGVRRIMRKEGLAMMIGSIADRVVHHSTRPVLVVRSN